MRTGHGSEEGKWAGVLTVHTCVGHELRAPLTLTLTGLWGIPHGPVCVPACRSPPARTCRAAMPSMPIPAYLPAVPLGRSSVLLTLGFLPRSSLAWGACGATFHSVSATDGLEGWCSRRAVPTPSERRALAHEPNRSLPSE